MTCKTFSTLMWRRSAKARSGIECDDGPIPGANHLFPTDSFQLSRFVVSCPWFTSLLWPVRSLHERPSLLPAPFLVCACIVPHAKPNPISPWPAVRPRVKVSSLVHRRAGSPIPTTGTDMGQPARLRRRGATSFTGRWEGELL